MTGELEGRKVLITGGSSGIGLGIARCLCKLGAVVAINGRRSTALERAKEALEAEGLSVGSVPGDVSDPSSVDGIVDSAVEAMGGLDVLVNNAGIARGGPLEEMSNEDIDATFAIDLVGPVYMIRAALPALTLSEHGSIINISSSVTLNPPPNFAVYSAAKAGLEMLTRSLALDFAPRGIRVNAISPGVVDTPIFATMMDESMVPAALGRFARQTPLGRVGAPSDIGQLAAFLASCRSEWMTGAIIPLDGGLSLS